MKIEFTNNEAYQLIKLYDLLRDTSMMDDLPVEIETAFDKIQENVFIDNVHFGDKGSKILADKFFEISVDNVEILRNLRLIFWPELSFFLHFLNFQNDFHMPQQLIKFFLNF